MSNAHPRPAAGLLRRMCTCTWMPRARTAALVPMCSPKEPTLQALPCPRVLQWEAAFRVAMQQMALPWTRRVQNSCPHWILTQSLVSCHRLTVQTQWMVWTCLARVKTALTPLQSVQFLRVFPSRHRSAVGLLTWQPQRLPHIRRSSCAYPAWRLLPTRQLMRRGGAYPGPGESGQNPLAGRDPAVETGKLAPAAQRASHLDPLSHSFRR
mmetsp:Transcript_24243/g.69967  ORF Transcript_24243/g.69967 Transcript_24243/m.69967 type:complete len:210 (-) Transcript_24243:257-886(-)